MPADVRGMNARGCDIERPDPSPCDSSACVHEYVAAEKTFKTVAGSGGVSAGPNELEGIYALN